MWKQWRTSPLTIPFRIHRDQSYQASQISQLVSMTGKQADAANLLKRALCVCLCFSFFLYVIRIRLLGYTWIKSQPLPMLAPNLLIAGYYDIAYSFGITLLFLGPIFLARGRLLLRRFLYFSYVGIAFLSVFLATLNYFIIRELARPFNYQILYYSDFLTSKESYDGIFVHLTVSSVLALIGVMLAMIVLTLVLIRNVDRWWPQPHFLRWIGTLSGAIVVLYFPLATWRLQHVNWDHFRLVNPVVWFVNSVVQSQLQPGLFTMELSDDFVQSSLKTDYLPTAQVNRYPAGKISNVILVTLESVGYHYVPAFGSEHKTMPELERYLSSSIRFPNIYASAPTSNKSLVSILASIYPWLSYAMLTDEYPDFAFPTLSSELKQEGYRTTFLSAGDTRYQGADIFLSHRKFDLIKDQNSLNDCQREKYESAFAFMNGVDEMCIIDELEEWIDQAPEQPFFAMLWTQATHYPYYTIGEQHDYGVGDEFLNRYLNALHHTDKMIGRLLDSLKARGLLDSTLVIIYGDHGEAFGQHNQEMHAWNIYEENVHVPFIMINPQLFHGEEDQTIGGLLDIAPTVMGLLGEPAPNLWQGRNLLRASARQRVYFYAPWWDTWFGYREGNYRFLYNGIYNKMELYDLSTDPGELVNIADEHPELVDEAIQHLGAWVQYQTRFINKHVIKVSSVK